MMDVYARQAIENKFNGAQDVAIGTALRTLLAATVGINANGWLLGTFRAPEHLLGLPGKLDMRQVETFYLLKGTPRTRVNGRPIKVDWKLCGELARNGPDGAAAFKRYEECRDA